MELVIAFIAGTIVGAIGGAYGWYRWGSKLAADAAKIKSVV